MTCVIYAMCSDKNILDQVFVTCESVDGDVQGSLLCKSGYVGSTK